MLIYFNGQCSEQVMSLFYIQLSVGIKQSYPGLGYSFTVNRYLTKALSINLIYCILHNHPSNCLSPGLSLPFSNFTRFRSVTLLNRILLDLYPDLNCLENNQPPAISSPYDYPSIVYQGSMSRIHNVICAVLRVP
jgi:hypothetical protein